MKLRALATARSGDKGADANIALFAKDEAAYQLIESQVSEEALLKFFEKLGVTRVKRYAVPQLATFNFVLYNVLGEGGSLNLRSDAQGKALGELLLEMEIENE